MSKKLNYQKGKNGEMIAKNFLIEKGYKLIDMNFKIDVGEIDLIMVDNDWLVFVEVKYKNDNYMGNPEDMINKRKIAQVRRMAEIYLLINPLFKTRFKKYRIDAVCILNKSINYYKNIYD